MSDTGAPKAGLINIGEEAKPPFAVLPDLSRVFKARSERFAELAQGHQLAPYLEFLSKLTAAQHSVMGALPPAPALDPEQTAKALAHGMPVLATPVFGVREQLAEGSNALVFEPGDAEALAGHMGRLVRDRGLRSTMSAAARAGYEALPRFDEMLDAYAAVFRRARGR